MTDVWHIEEWAMGKGVVRRTLPKPELRYRFARRIVNKITYEIYQAVRRGEAVVWVHVPWCQCEPCVLDRKEHPRVRDRATRYDHTWN